MGMYNQIEEVESNVVKITTGGLEKEYNKTDLKCSATDIMVFLYYYTDSKNQIVASWNAYQADLYGYTLSSLKSYIDGLLSSSKAASEVATILFKSITQTIVTGKTVETSIYSIPLPMDGSDYMIKVYSQAQVSTYAGSHINHKLRVGTYSSVIDGSVGANSIGQQTIIAMNGLWSANQFPITRNFKFVGGASGYIYGNDESIFTGDDANSTTPFSLITSKDFTTQHYLYVTFFTTGTAGAVVQHNQILVTLIKI